VHGIPRASGDPISAILPRLAELVPERVKDVLPRRLKDGIFDGLVRMGVTWQLLRRKRSKFVTSYLDGLKGVEIGAASHNCFYLDAINVDRYADDGTEYKRLERRLARRMARVDVVASGDDLPFEADSQDFVFSSHVIEHFPDPIKALSEWVRVARRYVVVVVPHRDRTFDADRPLTPVDEFVRRRQENFTSEDDLHWSVWTCESFLAMCGAIRLRVLDHQDPDDKVGNGFTVVIDASAPVVLPTQLLGGYQRSRTATTFEEPAANG
jgi:SAM-dependent methyltransferase